MVGINELTRVTDPASGDVFPVWSQSEGENRGVSLSQITAYLQNNLSFLGAVETLRNFAPATGETITVDIGDFRNLWIALAPSGTLATLTIDITGVPESLQEISVSTSAAITALTFTADQSIQGAAGAMAANGFFRLKYDGVNSIWRRVG